MDTSIITSISQLQDLRPSSLINSLFSRLVGQVVAAPATQVFSDEDCRVIQAQAARAEQELELVWARKITTSNSPSRIISKFPYYANYTELVRRELALVDASGLVLSSGAETLIVGSGPLPLTAIQLAQQRGVHVSHVDASPTALAACEKLCYAIGLTTVCLGGMGQSVSLPGQYDLIIIAALAGTNAAEKQAIIDNVLPALKPGGRILVRSARGARALLYPSIEASAFRNVRLLEEYHPDDEIINSVFIYEGVQ